MSTGIPGFSEADEIPLAMGELRGVRFFRIDQLSQPVPLSGAYSYRWQPGENVAECKRGVIQGSSMAPPLDRSVPHQKWRTECGCGFWGYWDKGFAPDGEWHVLAVIEAWGRVIRGPRGFRATRAKLAGFHLACELIGDEGEHWRTAVEETLKDHYKVPWYATEAYMLDQHPLTVQYAPPPVNGGNATSAANTAGGGGSSGGSGGGISFAVGGVAGGGGGSGGHATWRPVSGMTFRQRATFSVWRSCRQCAGPHARDEPCIIPVTPYNTTALAMTRAQRLGHIEPAAVRDVGQAIDRVHELVEKQIIDVTQAREALQELLRQWGLEAE